MIVEMPQQSHQKLELTKHWGCWTPLKKAQMENAYKIVRYLGTSFLAGFRGGAKDFLMGG